MSPGPLAGGKAVAQRGAERPGRELRCVAVQDDRRLGRGRDVGLSPQVSLGDGVDEGRARVSEWTDGEADGEPGGEVAAQPLRRDDELPPPRWAHDRLEASLRRLNDVLRRWYRPAERGHARAVHILGKKLEERDAGKAEECFRWAARTGDTDAIADLGVITAVRGDLSEAKGLFVQAALLPTELSLLLRSPGNQGLDVPFHDSCHA